MLFSVELPCTDVPINMSSDKFSESFPYDLEKYILTGEISLETKHTSKILEEKNSPTPVTILLLPLFKNTGKGM